MKLSVFVMMVISMIILSPVGSSAAIIFEDDFDGFVTGWVATGTGSHVTGGTAQNPGQNDPPGWTGYNNGDATNSLAIVTGEGRGGSPALKIGPAPGGTWLAASLIKWLGPVGYDEIYMRYYIKYDQDWLWGDGQTNTFTYQKLNRIWQNVSTNDILGTSGKSISSELDRGFIVFTVRSSSVIHPVFNITATHNYDGGHSASGARSNMYWYPYNTSPTEPFLETYFGTMDANGGWNDAQTWHCIEIHLKLASAWPADDGEFDIWVDGVLMDQPTWVSNRDSSRSYSNMPTEKLGTGINYIVLNDNGDLADNWGSTTRYVWFDDFVVSTSYIGPESVPVGGYSQANVIPASQLSQATDGSGTITINFKALDEFTGTITLNNFEYSTDGGSTWTAPTNADSSAALTSNWADNSYSSGKYAVVGAGGTSAEWSAATAYSFTLNTKHADIAPLNQYEGDVKFRFYVNNGNPTSSNDPVQTETFSLDNMPPEKMDPPN